MIKIKQILGLTEALDKPQIFQAYNAAYSDSDSDLKFSATPVWVKYSAYHFYVTNWKFDVNIAPVGDDILFDIHKNGTSIFSSYPKIKNGENVSTDGVLTTPRVTFEVGDKIEVFIKQVGSTVAGKGLSGDPIGILIQE